MSIETEIDGGVALVTIDRGEVRNALDNKHIIELTESFRRLQKRSDIGCVVVTGKGSAFCAGQDLKERMSRGVNDTSYHVLDYHNKMLESLQSVRVPTIAAVNGVAAGGGVGLALACDIRILSSSARFVFPFAQLSLALDSGISFWLPRMIGLDKGLLAVLGDSEVDAARAMEMGLGTKEVSRENFVDVTRRMAQSIAQHRPDVTIRIKRQLQQGAQARSIDEVLRAEAYDQGIASASDDHLAAMENFVNKKRDNLNRVIS